jgi:hypothetical protein
MKEWRNGGMEEMDEWRKMNEEQMTGWGMIPRLYHSATSPYLQSAILS